MILEFKSKVKRYCVLGTGEVRELLNGVG